MESYKWERVPREQVTPEIERQVIHTPSMTLLRVSLKSGSLVGLHSHLHEQVSMVMEGQVLFTLGGEEIRLQAGGIVRIPSNVVHSAHALEDSFLVDVFTPARTDWQ